MQDKRSPFIPSLLLLRYNAIHSVLALSLVPPRSSTLILCVSRCTYPSFIILSFSPSLFLYNSPHYISFSLPLLPGDAVAVSPHIFPFYVSSPLHLTRDACRKSAAAYFLPVPRVLLSRRYSGRVFIIRAFCVCIFKGSFLFPY